MYLYRRSWVNNGDFYTPAYRQKITVKNGLKATQVNAENIRYVIEEVAYWRKENHIHKWFVDNVQSGKDDCGEYPVSVKQLEALYSLCRAVVDKAAPTDVLPTMAGFFFGRTDYDDSYFDGCQQTIDQIGPLLTDDQNTFYYSSSW